MTKLSDTQAVTLSAASQREDRTVLPLPETLKIKGGAVNKVLGSLKAKGLIDHHGAPRGDDPPPLRITRAGLQAIGVETEDDAPEGATPADTGATSADAGGEAIDAPAPVTDAERAATRAKKGKAAKRKTRVTKAASAAKPTPRTGTKQANTDRPAQAPRRRHRRADRCGHRLAASHDPRRHLRRAQEEAGAQGRGHAHPRGRPQQARRQGQHHRLPDPRVRKPPMIIERPRRRGYQLHAQGSPEAEALLSERGLTRADLDRGPCRAGAHRGHPHPDHRGHQPRRRVRQPPGGLAARPARCLATGPGAAWARA